MTQSQIHYLLIFSGITAFGVLVGFIALGALALAVAKFFRQITDLASEAKGKVYPILDNVQEISDKVADISQTVREFTAEAAPKLRRATQNIVETSDVYRAKVAEIDALITDTADKARRQSDRVDSMVTSTLDHTGNLVHTTLARTQHLMDTLSNAIFAPVRQVSGLVNGARASIESLLHSFTPKPARRTPKPSAFEGESVYTELEDDYHA